MPFDLLRRCVSPAKSANLPEEEQRLIDIFYLTKTRAPVGDSRKFLKETRQQKEVNSAEVFAVRQDALNHPKDHLKQTLQYQNTCFKFDMGNFLSE